MNWYKDGYDLGEAKDQELIEDDAVSILDQITTAGAHAPRITIYGKPGVGKSTLASQFPVPLFLLTEENGLDGVKKLGVITEFKQLWSTIKSLLAEDKLPFKTLVIDSISKLDSMVIRYILDTEPLSKNGQPPSSINSACGGYGAGFAKAAMIHRSLKAMFDQFQAKGITVVYISHLDISKYKAPDSEDYDIYTIVMNHNKSREVYIDDVDLVAFCRLKSYTSETESGRVLVRSTSDRIIHVGANEGHVSKNRYNMPDELTMTFSALAEYIPFYNTKEQKA